MSEPDAAPLSPSSAPHVWIKGLGPAGALLALRARSRGWRVTASDPRVTSEGALPEWPATYGMLEPEVPAWARPFVGPSQQLRVITESERTAAYRYCMLDTQALRAAVQAAGVHITSETSVPAGATVIADCTGAPVDSTQFWQVAVGVVLPFSFFGDATLPSPVFMDWSASGGELPSFMYVQHVDKGVLFEETVLATRREPGAILPELERRVEAFLDAQCPGWRPAALPERETVAFPMGTRKGSFLTCTASKIEGVLGGTGPLPRIYFGAAGGMINPATGYSVGGAMLHADQCLDALEDSWMHAREGRLASLRKRANAELARFLRRLGAELIHRADGATLRNFFDAFFALSRERQLVYLTGHDGLAVARTMWAMRARTGFTHPFLMPLWKTPRQVLRAVLKKSDVS